MQEDLLEHVATIQKLTTSKDASGGTVNTYTTRKASVRCIIRPASSSEVLAFSAQQLQVSHVIVMLYADVGVGDKVINGDGRQFDVRGIAKAEPMGNISGFTTVQGWELV